MNGFYRKFPNLKNSSREGKLKTAESHLYISNMLWLSIFQLILLIPGSVIVTTILRGEVVPFKAVVSILDEYWWYIFLHVIVTAIASIMLHRKAMAIYDHIEE